MRIINYLKRPLGIIMLLATLGSVAAGASWTGYSQDAPRSGQTAMLMRDAKTENKKNTEKKKSHTAAKTVIAGGNYNKADVTLLAKTIHGEARGESFTGQVAVGAVILNRINDPKFPKSIPAVVYQPGAFTAVSDGQINLPPDQTSIQAAEEALKGWDPSGGALYYYNPAKSTSSWIWTRPVINQIGKHIFAL
ncbi:MAG: cell wall hydrolase [Bacillota bacterium]